MTTDASYALAGDNVSLGLTTYVGGTLADAANLPQVTLSVPSYGAQPSAVSHVGTGQYRAWMVLPAVRDGGRQTVSTVTVTAAASVGGSGVSSAASISWITPGLFLRFYADLATVHPVQPMHLTAQLLNGTRAVDADAGTMRFWAAGYLGPRGGPITPNRTAAGVYAADVVLDSAVAYGFVANATVGGVAVTAQLTMAEQPPYVPYAGFNPGTYQGWFQTTFSNATHLRGTFWVANAWGTPAPAVTVALRFGPLPGRPQSYANGTTDVRGAMPVDVNVSAGPTFVAGEIGAGTSEAASIPWTLVQGPVTSPPLPNSGALAADAAVMPDGSLRDFLAAGATVVRRYHVPASLLAAAGSALPDAPLNYYLVGGNTGTVYAAGHAVTDADGNFSLTFTVPPEGFTLQLDIEGFPSPTVWLAYAVGSPDMGLEVGPLTLGGPTDVTTPFSARAAIWVESEPPMASVWACPLPLTGGPRSKWAPGTGCAEDSLRENAAGLNATLFLPSFLPGTGRYLVYAWAPSQGGSATQFAVLSPGQSASVPVGGPGGPGVTDLVPWMLLGVILGAIAVVALALYLRRRPPKRPAAPPPGGG